MIIDTSSMVLVRSSCETMNGEIVDNNIFVCVPDTITPNEFIDLYNESARELRKKIDLQKEIHDLEVNKSGDCNILANNLSKTHKSIGINKKLIHFLYRAGTEMSESAADVLDAVLREASLQTKKLIELHGGVILDDYIKCQASIFNYELKTKDDL
jgi:hypothetical protein